MNHRLRALLIVSLFVAGLSATAQNSSTASSASSGKAAPATAANASAPSQATVDAFLKKMFGWNQELTWKVEEIKPSEASGITQATVVFNTPRGPQIARFYITADQKYTFMADLLPFGADPFAEARLLLQAANGPVHGSKDATTTIVEFGDLECPACKAAQPNIAKLMEEEPKVRLVFQNYPLPQHKWAMIAAKYLDCLGRQNNDAAWKFIATTYDHQSDITEQNVEQMLKGYVKDSGGDPDAVAACASKPETEKRVHDSMALGEKLDVSSTPTFFIDGRKLVGFSSNSTPYDAVKAMVDFDVANAK
ncbi:MAG: thioredoxin domain-containing protein [Candidatus Korobacteraceae bacterium]